MCNGSSANFPTDGTNMFIPWTRLTHRYLKLSDLKISSNFNSNSVRIGEFPGEVDSGSFVFINSDAPQVTPVHECVHMNL